MDELGSKVAATNTDCDYSVEIFICKAFNLICTERLRELFYPLSDIIHLDKSCILSFEFSEFDVPNLASFSFVDDFSAEHGSYLCCQVYFLTDLL